MDVQERFRLFLDAHELGRSERELVTSMLGRFLDRAHENVQRLARDGQQGFADMIADGYLEQNRRSAAWLRRHASVLIA